VKYLAALHKDRYVVPITVGVVVAEVWNRSQRRYVVPITVSRDKSIVSLLLSYRGWRCGLATELRARVRPTCQNCSSGLFLRLQASPGCILNAQLLAALL
jgi:hypothetical protein